jgi:hypothetical protein
LNCESRDRYHNFSARATVIRETLTTFQWSPLATAALRRHSNLMPITVPNYSRKTIGISSEH